MIAVTVRPGGAGGTRTNTAEAWSADVADPVWSNNRGTASFELDPVADITVTKVADMQSVAVGQQLIYSIAVSNKASVTGAGARSPMRSARPQMSPRPSACRWG